MYIPLGKQSYLHVLKKGKKKRMMLIILNMACGRTRKLNTGTRLEDQDSRIKERQKEREGLVGGVAGV